MAAQGKNVQAMLYLGYIYRLGDEQSGVPIDLEKSMKYFKMAADRGNMLAMHQYIALTQTKKDNLVQNGNKTCQIKTLLQDDTLEIPNQNSQLSI